MQTAASPVRVDWPEQYAALPKEIFQREDVYRLELERIFRGPEWHLVAHRSELPNRGDFKTLKVGEAAVLVIHGDDGQVRVFLNSCPHRGTQLKTSSRGNSPEIECPYHRWLFNNRGDLLGAPDSDHFPESFRKEDYGLRQLRTEEYLGLVFATFDRQAPAFDLCYGNMKEYFAKALGGDGRLKCIGSQKVSFASNWKEFNDQEGYHAPLLHRAFRLLRWQGGSGGRFLNEYGHMAVDAELRKIDKVDFLHDPSLVEMKDPKAQPRSVVITLFPLGVVLKHLDVISIRYAFPRSPHETEVHFHYFHHLDDSDEMIRHRVRMASNLLGPSGMISLEDGAVYNRLHEGSGTPGSVQFQRGVRERLKAPCTIQQNDEAGNLVKWERYRRIMGFDR